MPMKAKGAQQARAQGIPQMETMMVAICKERTKGAKHIAPAKIRCDHCQAVRRSGLFLFRVSIRGARVGGPRGVNLRRSWSGDWTTKGRRTEPAKVMIEKTTRERDPTRPTSPRVSLEADALVSVKDWQSAYRFRCCVWILSHFHPNKYKMQASKAPFFPWSRRSICKNLSKEYIPGW